MTDLATRQRLLVNTSLTPLWQCHTSTLENGKILVTGGYNGANWLAMAELYDPGAGTWSMTSSMAGSRNFHTATPLGKSSISITFLNDQSSFNMKQGNGKILVAGGRDALAHVPVAELYVPVTDTTTTTPAPTIPQHDSQLGGIIGGAVGGFALLVFSIVVAIVVRKRRRASKQASAQHQQLVPLAERSSTQPQVTKMGADSSDVSLAFLASQVPLGGGDQSAPTGASDNGPDPSFTDTKRCGLLS
jgi:hypothetical protein